MQTAPQCPLPNDGNQGSNTVERTRTGALAWVSKLWKPQGASAKEADCATVARFAMKVIDADGKAATLDEIRSSINLQGVDDPNGNGLSANQIRVTGVTMPTELVDAVLTEISGGLNGSRAWYDGEGTIVVDESGTGNALLFDSNWFLGILTDGTLGDDYFNAEDAPPVETPFESENWTAVGNAAGSPVFEQYIAPVTADAGTVYNQLDENYELVAVWVSNGDGTWGSSGGVTSANVLTALQAMDGTQEEAALEALGVSLDRIEPMRLPEQMAPITSGGAITFIIDDGADTDDTILTIANSVTPHIKFCVALYTNYLNSARITRNLGYQNDHGWEVLNHGATSVTLAGRTESFVIAETSTALDALRAMGFVVESHVYPTGANDEQARRIVSKKHRASFNITSGLMCPPIPTYSLNRYGIDNVTADANGLALLKQYVDGAKAGNMWGVFYLHSASWSSTEKQQQLADLLAYIISESVPVLTVKEALDRYENIATFGDTGTLGSPSLLIGANGLLAANNIANYQTSATFDRGFQRFGVTPPSTVAAYLAGRVAVGVTGTGASAGPGAISSTDSVLGCQLLIRGTAANGRVFARAPYYNCTGNPIKNLWARFSLYGDTMVNKGEVSYFMGLQQAASAAVLSMVNCCGFVVSDELHANIQAVSTDATTRTEVDTGLVANAAGSTNGLFTVELVPGAVNFWKGRNLLARITTNLPATVSNMTPLLQLDGPGSNGVTGYIALNSIEWGYNCPAWA